MTRSTIRALNRWRYRLEKGNQYLLALTGLVGILVTLVLSCAVVLHLSGEEPVLIDAVWWSFLRLSDPGYLGDDEGYVRRTLAVMLWFGGVFGITAFLISITTHIVSTKLGEISEFGAEVTFHDHTLIIGWNDKLFTLVAELLEADAGAEIAILGPLPKQDAERELDKRVFASFARRRFDARRQVVYRSGTAQSEVDLRRVAADRARTAIVLTAEVSRGLEADVASLRTFMALRRFRSGCGAPRPLATVLEITESRFRSHAMLAGQLDPRSDAWVASDLGSGRLTHLPTPSAAESGEVLTLVNSDELVSRAIAQCAIQPRLSRVLEGLLSFDGKEFFLARPSGPEWARVVDAARELDAAQLPAFLAAAIPGAMVCGVCVDEPSGGGRVDFSPEGLEAHFADSLLVLLGETRDFRTRHKEPQVEVRFPLAHTPAQPAEHVPQPRASRRYRVLLLGQNRRVPVLIDQFAAFTSQYDGLDLHLTLVATDFDDPRVDRAVERARARASTEVVTIRADYTDWMVLGPLLRPDGGEPKRTFDSIVLLAHDCDLGGDDVDARVILGVVMLRAFRSDPSWQPYLAGTSVVAEILDPQNVAIVGTDDWIEDVIVSSQYVSRYIAQVTMDHRVEDVYCELLDYGGREIYDRLAAGYAPVGGTFQTAVTNAAARGEIAFGYTIQRASEPQPTIHLAPQLDARLDESARLLVIAPE